MKRMIDKVVVLKGDKGLVGYALAWWLGVPTSVLVLIFLLRGCA